MSASQGGTGNRDVAAQLAPAQQLQYWEATALTRTPTLSLHSDLFGLASLRGAFSNDFGRWDIAVERNDTALARQARASIRTMAFGGLTDGPAAMGGFYLFIDPSNVVDLWDSITSVSLTDRRGQLDAVSWTDCETTARWMSH
jgi:hypothetical protein